MDALGARRSAAAGGEGRAAARLPRALRPRPGLRLRDLLGRTSPRRSAAPASTRAGARASSRSATGSAPAACGEGLCTEATAALTRVGFEVCEIERIEIRVDPANEASLAIPRKLGFVGGGDAARRLPRARTGAAAERRGRLRAPARGVRARRRAEGLRRGRGAGALVALHELALERRNLHGHFSRELEPVLEIDSGDTIAFATPRRGLGARAAARRRLAARALRAARPGARRRARADRAGRGSRRAGRAGARGRDRRRCGSAPFGLTVAGGWPSFLNDGLDVAEGESAVLAWELDADAGLGRDRAGREVRLAPFLGVLGMPPDEPGVHPTGPPRFCGGNLDCKELVAGTTLFLPIPRRRRALLGRGLPRAAGRRRGLVDGDRVPARARAS